MYYVVSKKWVSGFWYQVWRKGRRDKKIHKQRAIKILDRYHKVVWGNKLVVFTMREGKHIAIMFEKSVFRSHNQCLSLRTMFVEDTQDR